MKLYLHIPARPEPQPRPRGNFKTHRFYAPKPDFYYAVLMAAQAKRPPVPMQKAIRLCIRFTYKCPEAHRFEIYKTSRADLDNLEKAVMDALTEARWWKDDCLVVDKRTVKVWGACDGCEILAEELKNIKTFGEGWI